MKPGETILTPVCMSGVSPLMQMVFPNDVLAGMAELADALDSG